MVIISKRHSKVLKPYTRYCQDSKCNKLLFTYHVPYLQSLLFMTYNVIIILYYVATTWVNPFVDSELGQGKNITPGINIIPGDFIIVVHNTIV